jgi:hypothetical protein
MMIKNIAAKHTIKFVGNSVDALRYIINEGTIETFNVFRFNNQIDKKALYAVDAIGAFVVGLHNYETFNNVEHRIEKLCIFSYQKFSQADVERIMLGDISFIRSATTTYGSEINTTVIMEFSI